MDFTNSPAIIFILLAFLFFPLLQSGKLDQKGASVIASFIATIFSSPIIILPYILILWGISSLFF